MKAWTAKEFAGKIYTVRIENGVVSQIDKAHDSMRLAEQRLRVLNKAQVGLNRKAVNRKQQRDGA